MFAVFCGHCLWFPLLLLFSVSLCRTTRSSPWQLFQISLSHLFLLLVAEHTFMLCYRTHKQSSWQLCRFCSSFVPCVLCGAHIDHVLQDTQQIILATFPPCPFHLLCCYMLSTVRCCVAQHIGNQVGNFLLLLVSPLLLVRAEHRLALCCRTHKR